MAGGAAAAFLFITAHFIEAEARKRTCSSVLLLRVLAQRGCNQIYLHTCMHQCWIYGNSATPIYLFIYFSLYFWHVKRMILEFIRQANVSLQIAAYFILFYFVVASKSVHAQCTYGMHNSI